jgi:hypothetical protein
MSGVVYFIVYPKSQWVKIGYATRLRSRLSELQVCTPENLEVVATIPGTLADEQRLHRALKGARRRGEWFALWEPVIEELVEKAKAGISVDDACVWASAYIAEDLARRAEARAEAINAGLVRLVDDPATRFHARKFYRRMLTDRGCLIREIECV